MTNEILKTESNQFMELVSQAAHSKDVDVSKLSALLDMQERIMGKQAEIDFNESMSRLQPRIPQIERTSKAHNNKYAKLEDIDRIVRPLYTDEGFSISYDQKKNDDGTKTYFAFLSHKGGHKTKAEITLPDDSSGSKNPIQAVASTVSYARRHLIKMLFNIIEADEDNDGNYNDRPIDESQFLHIKELIDESEADIAAFCKHLKIECLKDMPNKIYPKAVQDLKMKISKIKAGK